MHWLIAILNFIGQQIFNVPAYLVGLITSFGLITLKKPVGEIIGSGIKATMGFLILGAGAGVVVLSLEPLSELILGATGARGVIPTNEVISALASKQYGTISAYILFLGFLTMIFLARFTPLKYVFLTGHHMVFMSILLSIVLSVGFGKGHELLVILFGSILLGMIMVILPALTQPWIKKIMGNDKIAVGHFGTLGYIVSATLGNYIGKKSQSTEKINFPGGLRFLKDSMISTSLSMVILYMVFAVWSLISLPDNQALAIFDSPDNGDYLMSAFAQALQFGIGVAIILYGVSTILKELVPAFEGIAKKIVPGAKPAIDVPMIFPKAPNAVLIGFLSSFAGGLVGLVILASFLGPVFGLALILPGMVPHFFTGGGSGIFGNCTGGKIGAITGGFINGMLITFFPAILLGVLGNLGQANSTFGDVDFCWYGSFIGMLMGSHNTFISIAVLTVSVIIILIGVSVWQVKVVEGNWIPGKKRDRYLVNDNKNTK